MASLPMKVFSFSFLVIIDSLWYLVVTVYWITKFAMIYKDFSPIPSKLNKKVNQLDYS